MSIELKNGKCSKIERVFNMFFGVGDCYFDHIIGFMDIFSFYLYGNSEIGRGFVSFRNLIIFIISQNWTFFPFGFHKIPLGLHKPLENFNHIRAGNSPFFCSHRRKLDSILGSESALGPRELIWAPYEPGFQTHHISGPECWSVWSSGIEKGAEAVVKNRKKS